MIRRRLAQSGRRLLTWSRTRPSIPLAAAVAYSLFLQFLASLPGAKMHPMGDALDPAGAGVLSARVDWRDFGHLAVYGFLGVLWHWALNSRRPHVTSSFSSALIVAPAVGILTEVSQIPMVTRIFSLRDLAFNVIAAVVGVVLTTRLIRRIEDASANPSLQPAPPGARPGGPAEHTRRRSTLGTG